MEKGFDWKEPWDTVNEAMSRVMDDFGTMAEEAFGQLAGRPAVALRRKDASFELDVAVPGVARERVDVSVDGRRVIVSGAWPRPAAEDAGTIVRDELPRGRFKRVVLLPAEVDAAAVGARLSAGVLTVLLPLREAAATSVPVEEAGEPADGPGA